MTDEETISQDRRSLGSTEIVAIVFFAISVLAWMFGFPLVVQAIQVLGEPDPADAAIGALVVAVATLVVGAPMFLLSLPLAVYAKRLPIVFRVLSIVPGLLAVLAGCWMLVLVYS